MATLTTELKYLWNYLVYKKSNEKVMKIKIVIYQKFD